MKLFLIYFLFITSIIYSQESKIEGAPCKFTIYDGTTAIYHIGSIPNITGTVLTLCPNDSIILNLTIQGFVCSTTLQWENNGNILPGATTLTYTVRDTGMYTISCSYANLVLGPIKVIPCVAAGIEEINNLNITIYPNPVNNILNIKTEYFDNSKAKIFNSLGEVVLEKKLNSNSEILDMSFLFDGVYYFELENNKGSIRKKIIKEGG